MSNAAMDAKQLIIETVARHAVPMVVIDKNGYISFANNVFLSAVCHDSENCLKGKFFDLLKKSCVAQFRAALQPNCAEARPIVIPFRNTAINPDWQVLPAGENFLLWNVAFHLSRELPDTLQTGLLVCSPAGLITATDKQAAEICALHDFDYTSPRVLFRNTLVYSEIERSPVPFEKSFINESLQSVKPLNDALFCVRLPMKGQRWLLFSSQPLFNLGELKPYAVVCRVTDVTSLYTSYTTAHDIASNAMLLLDGVAGMLAVADDNCNLLFLNNTCREHFTTADAFLPRHATQVFPKQLFDLLNNHIQTLASGNLVKSSRCMLLSRFNKRQVFEVSTKQVTTPDGKRYFIMEGKDVTAICAAEHREASLKCRLESLVQSCVPSRWQWDIIGNICTNPSGEPETVQTATTWFACIHPADAKLVRASLKQAFRQQQSYWQMTYRVQLNGSEFTQVLHAGAIIYEGKQAVKMIGSIQNQQDIAAFYLEAQQALMHTRLLALTNFIKICEELVQYHQASAQPDLQRLMQYLRQLVSTPEKKRGKMSDEQQLDYAIQAIKQISWPRLQRVFRNEELAELLKILLDGQDSVDGYPIDLSIAS